MQPITLQVTLAVQQEVEARITETDALRRKHVERAQYEAGLACRRYMKVDPDNRLVADSLEAEWNNKLRTLAEAQAQYEQQTQKQRLLIDSQTREQRLSLAADFPRVWNDPSVEARERKRILRLLIEDVTLINGETIQVHVRLRSSLRVARIQVHSRSTGWLAAYRLSASPADHLEQGPDRSHQNSLLVPA